MSEDLRSLLLSIPVLERGSFILKSGQRSNIYIDMRKIISFPNVYRKVCEELAEFIGTPTENVVVAGVPMGGIPFACGITLLHNVPSVIIRETVKDHGTQKRIEGVYDDSKRIVLVEDVITTGYSVEHILEILRSESIEVDSVVCILDRQQGGTERLRALGYVVTCLFTLEDLCL